MEKEDYFDELVKDALLEAGLTEDEAERTIEDYELTEDMEEW